MSALFFVITLGLIDLLHGAYGREDFSRIKYYELMHFDVDLTKSNILEFTAFNRSYKIELIENEDMIPSNIRRTNGIPITGNEYFTSLTKSCHYHGKVLNDDHDPSQYVALSICNKRGIRGTIRAFNQTIMIKPSKYYLDPQYDRQYFHDVTDQHIVWKPYDEEEVQQEEMHIDIDIDINNKRRRALCEGGCNGGYNKIELLVGTDPSQTDYFKTLHGNGWYQALEGAVFDHVNEVSAKYGASNFKGWGIGVISVHLVELEVIQSYSGNYASMNLACNAASGSYCKTDPNLCECAIDGEQYLKKWTNYVKQYKSSAYDAAQLLSKKYFYYSPKGIYTGGWGNRARMCKYSATSVVSATAGDAWQYRGGAHEIGHNLGAYDDGQKQTTTCASGQYIMGGNYHGFSQCSFTAIKNHFFSNSGLTCLSNNPRAFKSNTDGGSSSSSTGCVGIASLSKSQGYDFNGYWKLQGNKYSKSGWTLTSKGTYWIVDYASNGSPYAYCNNKEITACKAGTWNYINNGQWANDWDAFTYDCSMYALGIDDNDCDFEQYDDVICIEKSSALGTDDTQWELMTEICENDHAVYEFEDDETNTTYYLYYELYKKYNDDPDDEKYAKWVISIDEVFGVEYAYCEQSDLTDCTEGQWYSFEADYDSISTVNDSAMRVYKCKYDKSNEKNIMVIVIIVVIVVLVCVGIAFYVYYRYRYKASKMKAINDESDQEIEVECEAEPVEVENLTVTQTHS